MKIPLAPQHAAGRLQLSTSRLAQLDREGVLRAFRDSAGRRFYDPEVVEQFARAREEKKHAIAEQPLKHAVSESNSNSSREAARG